MSVADDYWGFDETGGMFTCDKCKHTKFVDNSELNDKQVLEWLYAGDDIICGECALKMPGVTDIASAKTAEHVQNTSVFVNGG